MPFVSRAGEKLEHALKTFGVNPKGLVCADFGSSTGGFVDCLLQHGAEKVYAVETGYGTVEYKLRVDRRVTLFERTNAMHVTLPEKVSLLTIDTSWTRLKNALPNALANLAFGGKIIALVKPHYEAPPALIRKGRLPDESVPEVIQNVRHDIATLGLSLEAETESPIVGEKGKNREFLFLLSRSSE